MKDKVEVQVLYPYVQHSPDSTTSWDCALETAIELALGEDASWAGWDNVKHSWATSLNVNPKRIPYIKHAIKSAFGDDVKVRA